MSLGFKLGFQNFQLPLDFIEVLAQSVNLLLFGVDLHPMACLNVFLNLHAHNVSVNRKGHLAGHHFNLTLLLLDRAAHVVHPLFKVLLQLLPRLDFLS
jgi:hypothetical protein